MGRLCCCNVSWVVLQKTIISFQCPHRVSLMNNVSKMFSQKMSPGERSAKGVNVSKQNTATSSSPTHGSRQMNRFTHPSCPSSLSFHSFSALFGCFRQRQARCPDLQVVVLQPRFDFLEVSVHPFNVVLDGLDRLLHTPKLRAFLPRRTEEFFHLLTKKT